MSTRNNVQLRINKNKYASYLFMMRSNQIKLIQYENKPSELRRKHF